MYISNAMYIIERTKKLLRENPPDVVKKAVDKDFSCIMLSNAKNYGLNALPEKGHPEFYLE